jgi:hypothetical protein
VTAIFLWTRGVERRWRKTFWWPCQTGNDFPPALYKASRTRSTTLSPWRWQLQCLPKRCFFFLTFDAAHTLEPRLYIETLAVLLFTMTPIQMKWCLDSNSDKDWAPLPLKVKMDGAGWYRFGLACGQSVHEVFCRGCGMESIEWCKLLSWFCCCYCCCYHYYYYYYY